MAEIVSLAEAVERTIHDGDAVAMEGLSLIHISEPTRPY